MRHVWPRVLRTTSSSGGQGSNPSSGRQPPMHTARCSLREPLSHQTRFCLILGPTFGVRVGSSKSASGHAWWPCSKTPSNDILFHRPGAFKLSAPAWFLRHGAADLWNPPHSLWAAGGIAVGSTPLAGFFGVRVKS